MSQQTRQQIPDEDYPKLSALQWKHIITLAEEGIEYLNSISQDTEDLDVYLVGGAVRDALIGKESNDLDFVVVGETMETMKQRGFNDINASSFGILHDENREEWALARTETKDGDGYKGISVDTQNVSLREDLKRRDLRMNAMALRLGNPTPDSFSEPEAINTVGEKPVAAFIDPFNGRRDIEHGEIQHVSDAFSEDPVRVLRAARYASRFRSEPDVPDHLTDSVPETVPFVIHPDTKRLMQQVAPELNRMSRDRIGQEVVKAMKQATDPTKFWDVLRDVGALAVIAPKLDRASIVPAGPEKFHREGDTYTHTMMVLNQMHSICEQNNITGTDRVRRYMMAISHDLGKVVVADESGGLWSDDPPRRFGGHAQTGIGTAETLATTLGLDGHINEAMQDAAALHMDIHDLPLWDVDYLIEFIDQHTPPEEAKKPYTATIEELLDLAAADHQGRFQTRDDPETDIPLDQIEDDSDAPDDAGRPVFNPDPYFERVKAVRAAIEEIDGFSVLRSGLCDDHKGEGIPDENLSEQLSQCESCRTPGPWVGEAITTRRTNHVLDYMDSE